MEWYVEALKKYAVFSGRAGREEFWMFTLCNLLIAFLMWFVDALLGIYFLGIAYCLVAVVPAIAVSVRRLHDSGRTGWWFLSALMPPAGPIIFFVFMVQKGKDEANVYGDNPKVICA